MITRLRELLLQEGVPGHYSGHSFRRGAATWAQQAGISGEDIQLLGRWTSDAYKRYIEVHPEHILGVSRRLQTFSPSAGPPSSGTPSTGPPSAGPPSSGPPWPAMLPPISHLGIANTGPPGSPGPYGRHVGVLGRVGRGAGEPGPASGVSASASGTQGGPGLGGRPPRPSGSI